MVTTTRAGAKRENSISSTAKTTNAENNMRTEKTQDAQQNRSHLLELPPELRNRIYRFASESNNYSLFGTHVKASSRPQPWATRGWQFFALTQTCRQIRGEYRPLWIRAMSLWVKLQELSQFVDTFMPTEADLKHAPKMIRASWFHEVDLAQKKHWNITPLLRLFAHRPDFSFEFIPYRMAMDLTPDVDGICDYCMETMELDEQGLSNDNNSFEFCECVPDDWDYKDWEIEQYDDMAYMEKVQSVLENRNTVWLDAIRNGDINVEFVVKDDSERITVMIRCKNSFILDKSYRNGAWDLLRKWGLLGSWNGFPDNNDFVFSFESKKSVTSSSGRHMTTDTFTREVCITKVQ